MRVLTILVVLVCTGCASVRERCLAKAEEMPPEYRKVTYEKCLDYHMK